MNILEKNVLLKPSSFHLLFQICSNYQKEIEQSSNICWDSGARRVVLYENHHRVAQPYENHGMQKQFWTRTQISWYAKYPKIEKPSEFQAFFMFFSVFMVCKVCIRDTESKVSALILSKIKSMSNLESG